MIVSLRGVCNTHNNTECVLVNERNNYNDRMKDITKYIRSTALITLRSPLQLNAVCTVNIIA